MSDYRAIAGVTGTLQQFLYGPLSKAVPGTTVRTGPPSASLLTGSAAAVNIFLYQVNPNTSWRNAELPVRRHDGSVEQRPLAALDLYYILSFYGSESKMVPQLLLGAAVAALHAHPLLDAKSIPEFLDGKSLEACGLAEQAQVIKFRMMPLSHEELGRIWSVFFQVPYTLSLAYQCSVVLLEPDLEPEPAMPVLATRLGAMPWQPAIIDRVEPPVVEYSEGAVLRLEGTGLAAPQVSVRFGSARTRGEKGEVEGGIEVKPALVNAEAVEVALPPELPAGANTIQVVHRQAATSQPSSRSNPASFVLVPRILATPARFESKLIAGKETRVVTLSLEPPVVPGQSVELLLNPWPGAEVTRARSYQVKADPDFASGDEVTFPLARVEPGSYLARVEVDGVASRLLAEDDATSSDFGRFVGPRIEVP